MDCMDEKELKTSPKQRFFIILIAVLMVGSIIASYAAIVIAGSNGTTTTSSNIDETKVVELKADYDEKQAEFEELAQGDFADFIQYKSRITAYNESAANSGGVTTEDLKVGTGREIGEDDEDYLAYYVGWCADETVFDSSFDDASNPTAFTKILDASLGMIEGWTLGVTGMKIGGVRVITMPGELAYGDTMEICGGTNKPLKFMIMTKENEGELADLAAALDTAYLKYQYYAMYGIEY